MKNKIIELKSYKELDIEKLKREDSYIVQLDGKRMETEDDFFMSIVKGFNPPYEDYIANWDDFNDFMTYLNWIQEGREINLIIYNSRSINIHPEFSKCMIDNVLPFWEKEISKVTIGGKTRGFDVYLIEDMNPDAEISG